MFKGVAMSLQQFFTNNTWWGKVIGAFLGYLMAGPTGALFGIFIGNFFDRGLATHYTRPHWSYHAEKRQAVQTIFFKATFSVMGHIAKADGLVSKQSIQMAKTIMDELGLGHKQKTAAQNYFNEGKNSTFNLNSLVIDLKKIAYDNPELLKLFIDIQYRMAKIDNLSIKKQLVFDNILSLLGFAPLHKQYRFYEDFANYSNHRQNNQHSSNRQRYYQDYQTQHSSLDHAYGILNVTPTTPKQDVKKAYQRLISRNHPDKLIAKGMSDDMIKIANEKTQKIRKAYEEICASKGW